MKKIWYWMYIIMLVFANFAIINFVGGNDYEPTPAPGPVWTFIDEVYGVSIDGIWADYNIYSDIWFVGGGSLRAYEFDGENINFLASATEFDDYIDVVGDGNYIYASLGPDGIAAYSFNGIDSFTLLDSTDDASFYAYRHLFWDGETSSLHVACEGDGIFAYTFNENETSEFWLKDTQYDSGYGFPEDIWGDGNNLFVATRYDEDATWGNILAYTFDGESYSSLIDSDGQAEQADYYGVHGDGTYIYVADSNYGGNNIGMRAYSFDGNFTAEDNYYDGNSLYGIYADENYIYTTCYNDGRNAYSFDGADITFLSNSGANEMRKCHDIWAVGSYVGTGQYLCWWSFQEPPPNDPPVIVQPYLRGLDNGTYYPFVNGSTDVPIRTERLWIDCVDPNGDYMNGDTYCHYTRPFMNALNHSTDIMAPLFMFSFELEYNTTYFVYYNVSDDPPPGATQYNLSGWYYFTTEDVQNLTVYVDDDFNESTPGWGVSRFDNIQAGIDAVQEGGEVYVANGSYAGDIIVGKAMDIYGESRYGTLINDCNEFGIKIDGDNINITEFAIVNNETGTYSIWVARFASNIEVTKCITVYGEYGLYAESVTSGEFYYNTFLNHTIEPAHDNESSIWDDGIGEGNFYEGYEDVDLDGDWIYDNPYVVPEGWPPGAAIDNYPAVGPHGGLTANVELDQGFQTIQEAIDNSGTLDGHMVYVYPGMYSENVQLNKELTMYAANRTIVNGTLADTPTIYVTSNNSMIVNFDVTSDTSLGFQTGIYFYEVDNASFYHNRVYALDEGLRLENVTNFNASENVYSENTIYGDVLIDNSSNCAFYDENFYGNGFNIGIYYYALGHTENVSLDECNFHNSSFFASWGANHIIILDCNFMQFSNPYSNVASCYIYNGNYVDIYHASYYGWEETITCELMNNGTIVYNDIDSSDNGILLTDCADFVIFNNTIFECLTKIGSDSSSPPNIWDDGNIGNYWEQYDEYSEGAWDNNSNGIADDPLSIPDGTAEDKFPLMDLGGPYWRWDINRDNIVNYLDLSAEVGAYGSSGDPGWVNSDINYDGLCNYLDVSALVYHYGEIYG